MNIAQEKKRGSGLRGLGTSVLSLWKDRPSTSLKIPDCLLLPGLFSLEEIPKFPAKL